MACTGLVCAGLTQRHTPSEPSIGTCHDRHLKTDVSRHAAENAHFFTPAQALPARPRERTDPAAGALAPPGLRWVPPAPPPSRFPGAARRHVSSARRGGRAGSRRRGPRRPPTAPGRQRPPRPTCYSGHYDITVRTAPRW